MRSTAQNTPDQYEMLAGAKQPAFIFTDQIVNARAVPSNYIPGSSYGVPPPASIAGQQATGGSDPNASAYASQVAARPAGSHPILWLVVLMVIGLLGLGFIAHMEVKRR